MIVTDDTYLTTDRHFKYKNSDEVIYRFNVYSFKFEGKQIVEKYDFPEICIRQGYVRTIACLCGANDWSDNGRFINEYECDDCGQFIEVITGES
ncbi:hypothetical protein ID853_13510 [Xenorhabdus sp. Vera]|uniref:hypothetical protein n=1 Tax=Xenorhabdus koppenhoeferi TaxID=351659 RepID=UPI0019A156AF|nr:hypothetical protein [Xenorhabdus sp. Vera]MBD2811877.1 hypothetical protein [Xenorhabdus sp. Vera]